MKTKIYTVLEEALKETKPGALRDSAFDPSIVLIGKDGILDSLDNVLFLDCVEEMLVAKMGKRISLVTSESLSRETSPFTTMQTLAEYIEEIL